MNLVLRLSGPCWIALRRGVLVACAIALVATSCVGASDPIEDADATPSAPATSPPELTPAVAVDCAANTGERVEGHLTTADGLERQYLLMVPQGISEGAPVPIVIDFHGAGSSAMQQARVSGFEALGRSERFAVITPDALGGRWSTADISFVEQLIEELGSFACIDGSRVFAAGMSNGGFFASRLACNLADRIIAIGTVTGIAYPTPCEQDRPVSIIHFHGRADSIVQFEPIPGAIDEWAQALQCADERSEQVTPSIVLLAHSGCEANTTVQFFQIENAGHTWPGSGETKQFQDVLGPTNDEIDATQLIWDFFNAAEVDQRLAAVDYQISQGETQSGLRYWVAIPDDGAAPSSRPVLYHLHGATLGWSGVKADVEDLAAMFEGGENEVPPIIVAPHDPNGWSMWSDSFDGGDTLQQLILTELIPDIERRFDASSESGSRWLQGFSMGGFGAASLGLRHPDHFGKIAILDGAMHDWQTLTGRRPHIARQQFGDDEAYFEQWSPWTLAASMLDGSPPMLLVAGSLTDWHRTYLAHVEANGLAASGIMSSCGHDLGCLASREGRAIIDFYQTGNR